MNTQIINYNFIVSDSKQSLKYIFVVDQQKEPEFTVDMFREMLNEADINLNNFYYSVDGNNEKQSNSIGTLTIGNNDINHSFVLFDIGIVVIDDIQKKMRNLIEKNKNRFSVINMVWNDACFELSKMAYPEIYIIENNMRELITRVMLKNFGPEWEKYYFPTTLTNKIHKDNTIKNTYENTLFCVDFKILTSFLFTPYSELENGISQKQLNRQPNISNKIVRKSNWDRCFDNLLNIDKKTLTELWEKLYRIRCKVAHNRMITKDDFIELEGLIKKLQPIINDALDNETPKIPIENVIPFIKHHISLILKDDKLKELVENCGNVCESHRIPKKDSEEDDELNFMNSISPHIALLQTLKEYTQKMDCIDDRKLFNNLKAIYTKIAALFYDEYIDYAPEISDNQEIKKHYNSYTKETETFFSTIPEEITEVIERLNRYYLNRKYRDE